MTKFHEDSNSSEILNTGADIVSASKDSSPLILLNPELLVSLGDNDVETRMGIPVVLFPRSPRSCPGPAEKSLICI